MNAKSDIILAFGQFVEPASVEYKKKLIAKMKKQGVKYRFMSNQVEHERGQRQGKKIYSLWDAYAHADLISYPSIVEGWGNQFIEAIFAKKPVFVFEYPVFKADIKKEGYKYISLGSTFKRVGWEAKISRNKLRQASDDTIATLLNQKTKQILNKNWQIGKKYHGKKTMIKLLKKTIN